MTKYLVAIVAAVLRVVFPAILRGSRPTAEDARRQTPLRDRLRQKIRAKWLACPSGRHADRSRSGAAPVLLLVCLADMPGCATPLFTRTIYVPHGEPVRLRETIHGARIWVLDADGKPAPGQMDLAEGWYCLPDPDGAPRVGEGSP